MDGETVTFYCCSPWPSDLRGRGRPRAPGWEKSGGGSSQDEAEQEMSAEAMPLPSLWSREFFCPWVIISSVHRTLNCRQSCCY